MKLLRFGKYGQEKPGCLDPQGMVRDLSSIISDIDGTTLSSEGLAALSAVDLNSLPIVDSSIRIGACVGSVGNFIAVGLNYVDHARETGSAIPAEPILFNKHTSCIAGPNDPVTIPRGSVKTDWEAEIAFVISKAAFEVSAEEAMGYIAGFCVSHDVSERAFQSERGGQWTKGKSSPSFGPLGPWLVTTNEIEDVQNLDVWLDVNGKRMQAGSTSNMIFPIAYLVSYISTFMRLLPGDVVTTGTPAGVGLGRKPQVFLKAGDVVELGVQSLGTQRQVFCAVN
jgi:2-keto-4-pentenoate hydratase/2-oxohepta-3-ene-1,7-dioic acid hydratase in catechol pathway